MKGKKSTEEIKKNPRFFYDIRKMKRFDGAVVPYGAVGCDYTLERFHNQAKCYCGHPGKGCRCKINIVEPTIDISKRKDVRFFTDPKPMLLFTIRHRKNPSFIYNFFTKDIAEVLDEVNRLNGKNRRTVENGFYLDETDFDERWNRPVVSEYKAKAELLDD